MDTLPKRHDASQSQRPFNRLEKKLRYVEWWTRSPPVLWEVAKVRMQQRSPTLSIRRSRSRMRSRQKKGLEIKHKRESKAIQLALFGFLPSAKPQPIPSIDLVFREVVTLPFNQMVQKTITDDYAINPQIQSLNWPFVLHSSIVPGKDKLQGRKQIWAVEHMSG